MLKQRIKKKNPVYISKVIYWSRKSEYVKKNQKKNKNKLALLQSMSNRTNSDKLKK